MSFVPHFSIFDIYNYLLAFNEFDHAKLRDYHRMEGYTMAKDGYVVYLESVPYINTGYVAVKAHVKPRTNDNDPVSKKGYYACWIILKTCDEGSIHYAYCTCKGG
ncbi:uncharacterized protein LOC127840584 [Dreissena polymorpha]|uniref:uncharacterized protein LOC127840584 n=1 Tax=Dreissena polymorpha TaxID=45954 RepID=UPI00226508DF|nr:uncharacterized protein LOC127840584 [Dreissena polymorpha]